MTVAEETMVCSPTPSPEATPGAETCSAPSGGYTHVFQLVGGGHHSSEAGSNHAGASCTRRNRCSVPPPVFLGVFMSAHVNKTARTRREAVSHSDGHLRIESIPVSKVNPAPYNPRLDLQPGDPEYQKLKRSIDEFGLVEPLVWNRRTGNLVGGHQRFKILRERGVDRVDVSVVDLSPEREKALNLALNKIAGAWDPGKLADLLNELVELPDFDMALTGFDGPEIEELLASALAANHEEQGFGLDAALAQVGEPVTKPGEIITLGADPRLQHRLLCGDCTDPVQVRRLMDGHRAIVFATDPPYCVGYDGTNHPGSGNKRPSVRMPAPTVDASGTSLRRPAHTSTRVRSPRKQSSNKDWSGTYGLTWDDAQPNPELYDKFIKAAIAEAIDPSAAWYCWHASRRQAMLEEAWTRNGAFVHAQIMWAKNRPVLTRTWYSWQHEPCFFGWIQGNKPPRVEDRILSTVWNIDTIPNGSERPDHPTPKPLEVFEIPLRQHSRPGEVCYEPFAGSGSQLIAAHKLGRRCFACEISPVYCDVIVRRYIAYAGESAVDPAIARRYRVNPAALKTQKEVARNPMGALAHG